MKSLTKLALKRPVSAMLIVLAIGVFGIGSVFGFRLELTPEMEMPMLFVMTVYQGGDPETTQELVTKVVEKVTCNAIAEYQPGDLGTEAVPVKKKVAVLDLGSKNNIIRCLLKRGCAVKIFPALTKAEDLIADLNQALNG